MDLTTIESFNLDEADDEPPVASQPPVLITELDTTDREISTPTFEESKRKLLANNGKLKLPHTINHIALRESFLSEAPFVVATNRPFWRKMIDNNNFQDMLCYSYYFITSCISDTAVVDLVKLASAKHASYIKDITTNLAQIYMTIPLKERDMFLPRCPEILAYLLVNAIRTAIPKHNRLMGMSQFRELLLDWCTELIGGLRLTNCRLNREWFFSDAIEGPILTNPIRSRQEQDEQPGVSKRKLIVNRSPLIDMFCDPLKLPYSEKPRTFTISHVSNRSLLSLDLSPCSPVVTDSSVRTRFDLVTHKAAKRQLSKSKRVSRQRIAEHEKCTYEIKKELSNSRKTLLEELRLLEEDKKLATSKSSSSLLRQTAGDTSIASSTT